MSDESSLIQLSHGSGGRVMHRLISEWFAPAFSLRSLNDSAVVPGLQDRRLAITTDSYVVTPSVFPGGDIGVLAVCGTVNDLAMSGARPLYLTAGFILEEGFPLEDLKAVLASMKKTAEEADVQVVAGDTKVVERGKGDGIYINTAGIGVLEHDLDLDPSKIRTGDSIILSGPVGSHGMAVMAKRSGITFDPPLLSDVRPLNRLVARILESSEHVRVMRDPTRGGLATTLKEFATASGLAMSVEESVIRVKREVAGACSLLGLDPLFVANEGVLVAVVAPQDAETVVSAMRTDEYGSEAAIIGTVLDGPKQQVLLKTSAGGIRIVDMISGEQLPRIC
ncbi:MAG: hydrogenase expression/formation protein HypE [Thermodesulfovibrionales bacterium]